MDRNILRSSVVALAVVATLAVPVAASAGVAGSRSARSARSAVTERGASWSVESLWNLVVHIFTGSGQPVGGLTHVSGANRGTIDPNGDPLAGASTNPLATPSGDADNRGTIDPNG